MDDPIDHAILTRSQSTSHFLSPRIFFSVCLIGLYYDLQEGKRKKKHQISGSNNVDAGLINFISHHSCRYLSFYRIQWFIVSAISAGNHTSSYRFSWSRQKIRTFLVSSFSEIFASIARDRSMAVDCPMSSQSKLKGVFWWMKLSVSFTAFEISCGTQELVIQQRFSKQVHQLQYSWYCIREFLPKMW